jgi:hypothetical protein
MNGFNPQLYNIDRQIQEERAKMAELERQKIQAYSQPTILNQTIQTGPGGQGVRYAESIDDVKREMIFADTLFVNKAFTNMWFKSPNGNIKTYLLEEFIPKDEKDLQIEALKRELEDLKKEIKDEPNRSRDNATTKSTISESVSTTATDEAE